MQILSYFLWEIGEALASAWYIRISLKQVFWALKNEIDMVKHCQYVALKILTIHDNRFKYTNINFLN